jgi:tetratricopeptide (TPR) repeat protein
MKRLALLAAAAMLATGHAEGQIADGSRIGQVSFANSGAATAQVAFHRGLALLHNFQYPGAVKAFQEAQSADPGFVMAYWGEAMAQNYTVWMEQFPDKARAALGKLGATPAERLSKVKTARERAFLEAVETLYGEGTKEERDFAYSAKMEQVHRAYPEDVDAAAFYGLSLLGLAHKGRDYGLYMRAAAILEEAFQRYQRHPGVVHYLIHSYDDPLHAPLGLRAARLYGAIAPDSHHAQHMTSHIFIALPDWQATIESNQSAIAISNRDRAADGKPPIWCGHYQNWLYYSFFQTDQRARASEILSRCRSDAARELAEGKQVERGSLVGSYVRMRSQWIAEVGRAPAEAPLPLNAEAHPAEAFDQGYSELLLARGNAAAVAAAEARLKAVAPKVPLATLHPLASKAQRIVLLQAEGLSAIAAGRRDAGIGTLRKAAEIERTMEVPFGPPMVEKPSFELLAEELLAAGRREEAAEAFRQALKLAPGRRLSVTQLARLEAGRPGSVSTAAAVPHKH